jgi:hypothetical protein
MDSIASDNETPAEARKMVLKYLLESRWISKAYESDKKLMLQWTEEGMEKLATVQILLNEIGCGEWTAKQKALALSILYLSDYLGPNDNGVVSLGEERLE